MKKANVSFTGVGDADKSDLISVSTEAGAAKVLVSVFMITATPWSLLTVVKQVLT